MAVSESKLKLLLIWELLKEKTDENHSMTTDQICEELYDLYGISSERKSVYSDIETINAFYDYKFQYSESLEEIVKERGNGPGKGYRITGRFMEPFEISVLINLLRSAKGISRSLEESVSRKLLSMVSSYSAGRIKEESVYIHRPKTPENTLFYNLDWIREAISKDRQIDFLYLQWTVQGDLVPRHNGRIYEVSPWKMVWQDNYYYLLAFEEKTSLMKTYRVDKMTRIHIRDDHRLGEEYYKKIDLSALTSRRIAMYGGKEETVTIGCRSELLDVFYDYFGRESLMVIKENEEYFRVRIIVQVSPAFFGWIASLGNSVQILKPGSVRNDYREYIGNILREYEVSE